MNGFRPKTTKDMAATSKMNIGISLAGISYTTSGKKRDFRKTSANFFSHLCNPLSASVYTTTYPHELNDELLATYNPFKHQFIPFEGSHPRSTLIHSLSLVEEEPLDFLICTRFDLKLNQKITDMDVDYTKFNFLFKEKDTWKPYKLVSDTILAFPLKYLYDLADAMQDLCSENKFPEHTFSHHIYEYLERRIGTENIHFIFGDEEAFSHDNRFYELMRTNG